MCTSHTLRPLVCQAGWWIRLFFPRHCVHDSRLESVVGAPCIIPGLGRERPRRFERLEHALKQATVICMRWASAKRRRRPIMSSNFLPREEMWFVAERGGGDGHSRITLEHLTLSPEELTKTKVHPPVMIRPWRAKERTVGGSWMTDEWHSPRLSLVCLSRHKWVFH